MINHVWSVLCSQSITNSQTNNLSLIEILEQLTITGSPLSEEQEVTIPAFFDVVSLWVREPRDQLADGFTRILFLSPANETLRDSGEHRIDLSEYQRARTIIRIQGFTIRGAGVYHLVVQMRDQEEMNWQSVARLPLEIRIQPAEEPTAS